MGFDVGIVSVIASSPLKKPLDGLVPYVHRGTGTGGYKYSRLHWQGLQNRAGLPVRVERPEDSSCGTTSRIGDAIASMARSIIPGTWARDTDRIVKEALESR